MVQGYYTLQEAAQVLGMVPEDLKQMAQRNQIRSFQDRGTWRFRVQDIQELARQRGATSDPDLLMGESRSPQPKSPGPKSPPKPGAPRTPSVAKPGGPQSPKPKSPEVFDFAVETGEQSDFGLDLVDSPSGSGKKKPDSKKPSPKPGSDSDVRLVSEGGDVAFAVGGEPAGGKRGSDSDVKLVGQSDSDVKIVSDAGTPRTPRVEGGGRRSGLGGQATPPVGKRPSKVVQPPPTPDSGVRLVPMDSDSDVKIVGSGDAEVPLGEALPKAPTDSDIRLENAPTNMGRSDEGMLTEEIDLDAELRKQEAQSQQKPQAKVKPKSKPPKFPQSSPFEISDTEMKPKPAGKAKPDSSDYDLRPDKPSDSSSDYDLQVKDSSGEFAIESEAEPLKGPSSGISISNPKDSGISLEQGGEGSDEIEFELSLEGGESTPKPAPEVADSDSEFELSLDLDESGAHATPSDSEFELTLDDSTGLVPEEPAPQAKGGDKDIFETDFEVPSLEDESGSQVAPLDTDLDSSDFDLAISDSEIAVEDESGSQVVALDEEEADAAAATVAARRKPVKGAAAEEVEDFGAIAEDEEAVVEEEAEERVVVQEKVLKPAPWGALPALILMPCVVVMLLVGMMGFELLQGSTSYRTPGMVTKTIGELMGQKMK